MDDQHHELPAEEVLDALDSKPDGLPTDEVDRRRAKYGENQIVRTAGRTPFRILLAQFDSVLIWVLVVAALLSTWAGHVVDAVLIGIIVVANGIFGFVQDYRAERSLEALREFAAPTVSVRRNGDVEVLDATRLVPGDVVLLEAGDVVPADGRLLETTDLEVDEATLTGESVPVSKTDDAVDADTPLAERTGMVYKGTNVTRGHGEAVVTDTGMETEVGEIATELATTGDRQTPLQEELDHLGRTLGLGILFLSVLVAPLLIFRGTEVVQAALTAVSLAVAAIPEGLPAVVTLTLALGVHVMSKEKALVRRLPAVEALGSVDVICTDKTGTLTKGQMTVSRIWMDDERVDLDDSGGVESASPSDREALVLRIGALCNDSTLEEGDPTEQALLEAAETRGFDVGTLASEHPRTGEVPFSSERKWMGTHHGDVGYVKGAPSVVLDNSEAILTTDGPQPLDAGTRDRIEDAVGSFADDALRVLAMAYVEDPADETDLEDGLTFVGIVGLIDPPREGVAEAIAASTQAGIDVKMVTGDNVRTAGAIAERIGIGSKVLEGREIERMSDESLRDRVESVDVFARTSPEHKVRILEALQARSHEVAMTGDGVNDAPALKNADVGVAMGIRGTDVARQASDIVLLDDNYATIERAIERGRAIYDNIWKFVAYLLSANVAEVAIVFLASLAGYLILPAVQLLWINLLTDGLPALALGADPEGSDVMDRPPRERDRGIIGRQMVGLIGGMGAVTTIVLLVLMVWALDGAPSVTPYAMTMVFTGFVFLEIEGLYVIRWLRETPLWSNIWLGVAVAVSTVLQLAVLYTPLNRFFRTVPLDLFDWGILAVVLAVSLPAYFAIAAVSKRIHQ